MVKVQFTYNSITIFLDLQQKCQGNSLGLFTALQTIGGLNPSVDSEINYWVKIKHLHTGGKKKKHKEYMYMAPNVSSNLL